MFVTFFWFKRVSQFYPFLFSLLRRTIVNHYHKTPNGGTTGLKDLCRLLALMAATSSTIGPTCNMHWSTPAMNHHLTITEVNPIYCDVPRLSARHEERHWCSDKNRHALALAETTMFSRYDEDLIKKRDPPKPKGICAGHKYGIYNLGRDVATGKVGYAVMNTNCKQATGTSTKNPCDDPLFSCSPPPIKLTELHYNGQDYACHEIPNAGKCPGGMNDMEFCCGDSASSD
ncbi:hypothetical protein DL96DRAFT_854516 [Flagelloscypha sp. PMI_526]|nr:hypothetical protein DL96DRAFT_854516 [Flagelloscypha sp. PMI_526]